LLPVISNFLHSTIRNRQSACKRRSLQSLPLPDKLSIAVLPFTNMSSDPDQEHFSDGMSDTLITDLSKVGSLFIIARNSIFLYKGKAIKPQQVSQELN
jgi:adenylate cyclase